MKALRVMLVSPVGEIGGAEQVFLSLAKHLPDYGIEPILACLRPGPLEERARQQGLLVYAFAEHRYRQWGMVFKSMQWLAMLIKETQADLVHSNHAAHLTSYFAAKMTGRPEIWHIHDYPYHPDLLERLRMRLPSDHVLFTTHRVNSGYPKLQKFPHSVVAPTCIDPVLLRTVAEQPGIRQKFDLLEGPLFVTVARLQQHKGLHYLLAAIPAVLKAYPNAIFAIAGKGSGPEQEAYRDTLVAQCACLGISKQARLLGYVSDNDLIALYRTATALVHPALSEGFGLTLLEAMSLGVPVIAAAADGPGEIITHGQNGWLVPKGDSSSLASAMIALLSDSTTAQVLSQGGRDFADTMNVDHMVSQTVAIYRGMTKS